MSGPFYDQGPFLDPGGGGGPIPSEASLAEINAGIVTGKYISPFGVEGSKYLNQSGSKIHATASGTNSYAATISPAITALTTGQRFLILFTNANTAAATINLNGLGAVGIKKDVSTDLASGDIKAGSIQLLAYDGGNFQIVGGVGGVSAHDLGGAEHNADTLANLNSKITDATLDDVSGSRPPSGAAGGDLNGNYPNPNVNQSSEAVAGKVELADQAETTAGLDDSRAVTPLKLKTYADGEFVHLTGDETIQGEKTFNDDQIVIDAPTPAFDQLQIGYIPADPGGSSSYGIRRSSASGFMTYMNQANFPQIIAGHPANVTGAWYLDTDNNVPIFLNRLDTGVGTSEGGVFCGNGGLYSESIIQNNLNEETTPPSYLTPTNGMAWRRPSDNIIFIYDATLGFWVSSQIFREGAGRNSLTGDNQYLRDYNGRQTNFGGILIKQDSVIVGLTSVTSNTLTADWATDIERNNAAVALATITQLNGAAFENISGLNVQIDANDRLNIFSNASASAVNRPRVDVFYRYRIP